MDMDSAYANAPFIPGGADYPARWAADAAAFRDALGARARLELRYGEAPRRVFDLFEPETAPRGLLIFVHGGFWRAFGKADWSHFATGALARGWAVAVAQYTLCPAARIAGITAEITAAIDAAAALIEGPMVLTGHSAGGHLSARMLCADAAPAARGRIARVVPISPLSDLRPLMQTALNDDLRLDAAEAAAESPIDHAPLPGPDVRVWVGGAERPAFLDQARWLSEAWGAPLTIDPHRHHFDVIDGLRDPRAPLMRTLLDGV